MDGDLGFGYTHRQKRTHAQMEHEGSVSPTWSTFNPLSASREPSAGASSHPHPHVSGLHLPHIGNMPSAEPPRYAGDGLDFRRPISTSRSNSQTNIIDLTTDDAGPSAPPSSRRPNSRAQRPPRFAREIIDVDNEDSHPATAPPDSPEIEFISSRRIDPPPRQEPPVRPANEDEDDVEFVRANRLPDARRRRDRNFADMDILVNLYEDAGLDFPPPGRFPHLFARIEQATGRHRHPVAPPRVGRGGNHAHIHVGFIAPTMDFETVAFDLGMGGGPAQPPPTYDAPAKAPEGFTRSPAEDDVLICPNCAEELCTGDTEQKKQVWLVKGCGHVYCGECTANRFIKRSAKGKEKQAPPRTKPFKECVVVGCGRKLSSRSAMIQVFL